MSVELVMPSNHFIPWHPLLLLPSIFPSIRVFYSELVLCISWPSIGASASTSVLTMNIQDWLPLVLTGLISLQSKRLKSLLQDQSSKASILWPSAFFMLQLSHPYITTGGTIALTRQTFVSKVMPFLFNRLSGLVIAFLTRNVFQASFNFMAAVTICSDYGEQENKVCHCFHSFPICLLGNDGTECHDLNFFECWVLNQLFHCSLSLSSRGFLVLLHFLWSEKAMAPHSSILAWRIPMDRGTWWATVHEVAKSQTWLSC